MKALTRYSFLKVFLIDFFFHGSLTVLETVGSGFGWRVWREKESQRIRDQLTQKEWRNFPKLSIATSLTSGWLIWPLEDRLSFMQSCVLTLRFFFRFEEGLCGIAQQFSCIAALTAPLGFPCGIPTSPSFKICEKVPGHKGLWLLYSASLCARNRTFDRGLLCKQFEGNKTVRIIGSEKLPYVCVQQNVFTLLPFYRHIPF